MLSVIVPFVGEYPQVVFTIRSIAENLMGRADFEVIAVDNWCTEVRRQGFKRDRGSAMIKDMAKTHDWLHYIEYKDKLSHWGAKIKGVSIAKGDIYFFVDAHCIVGRDILYDAFSYYSSQWEKLNGTLHLPLTYHILEKKRLQYSLVYKPEYAELHYTFSEYCPTGKNPFVFEVPCMSSCGMLIHKNIYDGFGGFPPLLGIYGGGENFVNFVLAIQGKRKYIFKSDTALYHHGEKRNYVFNAMDYARNRAIASYMFGGFDWMDKYLRTLEPAPNGWYPKISAQVLEACGKQKGLIDHTKQIDIEDWVKQWEHSIDK